MSALGLLSTVIGKANERPNNDDIHILWNPKRWIWDTLEQDIEQRHLTALKK